MFHSLTRPLLSALLAACLFLWLLPFPTRSGPYAYPHSLRLACVSPFALSYAQDRQPSMDLLSRSV